MNATQPSRAPRVSVLLTTFNHAAYVEQALESLRSQSSKDFEVIITDDASIDGSADTIAAWLQRTGFAARLIRNPRNRGICANRNAALALASGEFICSLSGDDAYEPDRIARQLACFLSLPEEVGAVYSDALIIDAAGRVEQSSHLAAALQAEPPPEGDLFERLLTGNFLPAAAVMVRGSAIAAVGGYDENLFYEDRDMWLKLAFRFKFAYLPGAVVRYRALANSMSRARGNQPAMRRSLGKILHKWLDAPLEPRRHRLVLHAILRNGAMQLLIGDIEGSRESFALLAERDPRPQRRLLARTAMLRGAAWGAKALRVIYHGWKRL